MQACVCPLRAALPSARSHVIFWATAAAGTAADLFTKSAVHAWLAQLPQREYSVIDGLLKLVIRENSGAAFSIAQGQRTALVAISVVAMLILLGVFFFGRVRKAVTAVVLGLLAAGILGNLYDRAFNDGLVRDFIEVYRGSWRWPAFNVADSLLCVAMGLVIVQQVIAAFSQRPAHPRK